MEQQRTLSQGSAFSPQSFLDDLKKTIAIHLDNELLDVQLLCLKLGMSRTDLHRKIKLMTGQSTTEFVRNFRLQEARRLLEKRKYGVTDVAHQVGFKYPNNFSTAFKNHFGHRPSEVSVC